MSTSESDVIRVAIEEALQPSLAASRQFLAGHRLKGSGPDAVAHVEPGREQWRVFFTLSDEPYYWVVVVDDGNGRPTVSWTHAGERARVGLMIVSDRYDPERLTALIGARATDARRRGDPVGERGLRTHPKHRWYLEPRVPDPMPLVVKLTFLLQELEPSASQIRELARTESVTVQAVVQSWRNGATGWHLDARSMARVASLGAEVDLALYLSGPA